MPRIVRANRPTWPDGFRNRNVRNEVYGAAMTNGDYPWVRHG